MVNAPITSAIGCLEVGKNRSRSIGEPDHDIPVAIDVFDFFSGCGGTSRGFADAGMSPVLAVDWEEDALATFRANFPNARTICGDVRGIATSDIDVLFPSPRQRCALLCACSPCQPFSKQNRHKSDGDDRRSLIGEIERFLRRFRPELVFLENVPASIKLVGRQRTGLTPMLDLLRGLGYHIDARVLDAADYGVPQSRKRAIVMASLLGPIHLPEPTHGAGRLPYRTVRDAIGTLPPLLAGGSHVEIDAHVAARLSETNLRRIKASVPGGTWRNWPAELQLACHATVGGYTDVYGRLVWDLPAPSLTTRCISYSNGRYGHPKQNRAISAREAAHLQSFHEDFRFIGGLVSVARQIGNAVPVALARSVGRAFADHVRDWRGDINA